MGLRKSTSGQNRARAVHNGLAAPTFATDETFTDKEGQKQERVEWHQIVAFGKLAETCNQYLKKGRQVYVEGRLRTREFEVKNNGGKRQRTEIVASRVQFLGPPAEGSEIGNIEESLPPNRGRSVLIGCIETARP